MKRTNSVDLKTLFAFPSKRQATDLSGIDAASPNWGGLSSSDSELSSILWKNKYFSLTYSLLFPVRSVY